MSPGRIYVSLIAAVTWMVGLLTTPGGADASSHHNVAHAMDDGNDSDLFTVAEVFELFEQIAKAHFPLKQERLAVEALVELAVAEGTDEGDDEEITSETGWQPAAQKLVTAMKEIMASARVSGSERTEEPGGVSGVLSAERIEAEIRAKKASRDSYKRVADAFWHFVTFTRKLPDAERGESSRAQAPTPPSKPKETATAAVKTVGQQRFYQPSGGNSEVIIFLNVSPMTLLTRICQGQQEACADVFQQSLHAAMQNVVNDPDFTEDSVQMGRVGIRGSGVQQTVLIYNDGDMHLADVLEQVLEDVEFCQSDPFRPICKTLTGQTLAENNVTPKVLSKRVIG
ncbi:hypothetical protein BESB_034820 [Besnoitia besnoiti]|uniref:Transmembrane protein n=1 Tax=Besnoitia besnoiti TaxID=94643 RepID=A0A2A9MIJ6_BESBE|nr:hypothetical protein BESB_034820 [Besnoitia besnoiti]PFH37024.1 hypothetical protein BESB_034820 [Besnoitia besnoiti]